VGRFDFDKLMLVVVDETIPSPGSIVFEVTSDIDFASEVGSPFAVSNNFLASLRSYNDKEDDHTFVIF
jgi:hypothetical protein